jgi:hypothetical protein
VPGRRPAGPDADGQYLHYLTKWAFALLQLSAAADEPRYLRWALELAEGTFLKFLVLPVRARRVTPGSYWRGGAVRNRHELWLFAAPGSPDPANRQLAAVGTCLP